jgi:hypothetical protein
MRERRVLFTLSPFRTLQHGYGSAREARNEPDVILRNHERVHDVYAAAAVHVRIRLYETGRIEAHVVLRYEQRIHDIDRAASVNVSGITTLLH